MKRCLSPDAPEGGSPAEIPEADDPPTPRETPAPPAPPAAAPAPAPAAAPPPAARIVVNGARSEREIELEAELAEERQAHATTAADKKAREQRIMELEDERRRLLEPPKPVPRTDPKPKRTRLTFFD
jgi:hypothetical protein